MAGSGHWKAAGVGEGDGAGATVTRVVTGVGPGDESVPPQAPIPTAARPRASHRPEKWSLFMTDMITHAVDPAGTGGVA
jgi:hypothetical protein